jgi:hypothetical protein
MTLILVVFVLLLCDVAIGTPLQPLLCGSLGTLQCVNVDFADLDDTRNSRERVDTTTLRQTDDDTATLSDPGAWRLTRSSTRLEEKSGIRGSSLVACPALNSAVAQPVGTYLRFIRITSVGAPEREIRSVFRVQANVDAWAGVAFAYRNTGADLLRAIVRPGDRCVALQRRVAGGSFQTLATATPTAALVIDALYEFRIRFGGGFVFVRLLTYPALEVVASMTSAAVTQNAIDLAGDYAVFSSDADTTSGTEFESFVVFNSTAPINEPAPVTRAPTPAPTPVPTPMPTTPPPTPARIDCVVSSWSAWSACSQTARCMIEPGRQTRQRDITVINQFGGAICPALIESQVCNVDVPCPASCNCVGCSVGSAVGSATWCRCCQFAMNPMCTAASCTTNNIYMKSGCITSGWCQVINSTTTRFCGIDKIPTEDFCGLPVPCTVSEWSTFSLCSLSCASSGGTIGPGLTPNGTSTRTRTVTRFQRNGGTECPTLTETAMCNTTPCPTTTTTTTAATTTTTTTTTTMTTTATTNATTAVTATPTATPVGVNTTSVAVSTTAASNATAATSTSAGIGNTTTPAMSTATPTATVSTAAATTTAIATTTSAAATSTLAETTTSTTAAETSSEETSGPSATSTATFTVDVVSVPADGARVTASLLTILIAGLA